MSVLVGRRLHSIEPYPDADPGLAHLCANINRNFEALFSDLDQVSDTPGDHALLSAPHTDTTAASVVRGDVITGQGSTPVWARLAIGTVGQVLRSDGTDVAWSADTHNLLSARHADTLAGTVVRGDLVVGNSTPRWARLARGAADTFLRSDGSDLGWSAITLGTNTIGNYTASVAGTTNRISVSGAVGEGQAAVVDIAATYVGQTSITTLGTITAGTWNGSDIQYAFLAQASGLSVLGVTGNATADLAAIVAGSDHQVLRRSGASVAFGAIDLSQAAAVTGDLAFANLAQGSALSVLGVTGNATADVASIAAGTDNQVLRRSGTALAFGAVNLASGDAVTGDLPLANLAQASGASVLLGRGSAAGGGDFQEITVGSGLTMSGTTLSANAGGTNALLDGNVHTDTVAQTVSRGSLIYGNSTPAWDELVIGAANSVLSSDGTDAAWSTTPTVGSLTTTGDCTVGGDLAVASQFAIGTTPSTSFQCLIQGSFTPGASTGGSFFIDGELTAGAGFDIFTMNMRGTITEAGSGTHGHFASVRVLPPTIVDGAASLTNATSLYITGAPSAATNNYALWVDSGITRLDDGIALGGGATPTLGTIGGSGPASAAQNQWLRINIGGTNYFVPVWA